MRKLIFLLPLVLLLTYTPSANVAAPDCDSAFYDCASKKGDYLDSCMLIEPPDHFLSCITRSQQIFNGCMTAWGCPLDYVPKSPRNGPGDN